jgi:glutathione S-transferase
MMLYDYPGAPNPRRVRMYLAEKGLEVPTVEVDLRARAQFGEAYRAVNPGCTVPALVLDDGTCIAESMAICRYFEALQPYPPLFGIDPAEKGLVEMWSRRAELDGYLPAQDVLRNTLRAFAGRALPGRDDDVPQLPELAERGRATFARFLARLDRRLDESEFLAGPRFTVADITAFVTVEFAARAKLEIPESLTHLVRWRAEVAARPSAGA